VKETEEYHKNDANNIIKMKPTQTPLLQYVDTLLFKFMASEQNGRVFLKRRYKISEP